MAKKIRIKIDESFNYQAFALKTDAKDYELAFLLEKEFKANFFFKELKIITENTINEDIILGYLTQISGQDYFLTEIKDEYYETFLPSKLKSFNFLLINLSASLSAQNLDFLKNRLNSFSFLIVSFVVSLKKIEIKI